MRLNKRNTSNVATLIDILISSGLDITDKTARRDLLELVELNLLTKQGERKASKYYFNS